MPGDKNGRGDRERARARAAEAWRLRSAGRTLREIAEKLGISHVTVKGYIDRTEAKLTEDMKEVARCFYARELEQIEYVQSQAMAAWEASKEDGKRVRRKHVVGKPDETVAEVAKREGDAKHLDVALRAIAMRRDMFERFGLEQRLTAIESQLATLTAGPVPGPPPRSPYTLADRAPAQPFESGGSSLFDRGFLDDLMKDGGEGDHDG